jgi:hypothetical protein
MASSWRRPGLPSMPPEGGPPAWRAAPQFAHWGLRKYRHGLDSAVIPVALLVVLLPLNKVYWDVGVRIRPWYLVAPIALLESLHRVRSHDIAIRRPLLLVVTGLWLAAISALASGLWAADQGAWVRNIGDLLLGMSVVAAIALAGAGPGAADRMVRLWIAVGVAMSVYGLLQFSAGLAGVDLDSYTVERISVGLRRTGLDRYGEYLRVTSFIEDSSNYSIYLCTVWPLMLFRLMWRETATRFRARELALFGIVVANLVLTLSRSGLLGSIAALFVGGWLVLRTAEIDRRRRLLSRRRLTVMPARMALLGLAALGSVVLVMPSTVSNLVQLRTQSSAGTSIHFTTLTDSFNLMMSKPWGIGLGGFPHWFQEHRRPWEPAQWSTFNSYTDLGAGGGLVALLAYVVILGALAVILWRVVERRSGSVRANAAGALVALVAVAVAAFGYNAFASGYYVGFLGLVTAVAASASEPPT